MIVKLTDENQLSLGAAKPTNWAYYLKPLYSDLMLHLTCPMKHVSTGAENRASYWGALTFKNMKLFLRR